MTPRRHVLAGIRRTIIVAAILALIILALSNQESTSNGIPSASEVSLLININHPINKNKLNNKHTLNTSSGK